MWATIMQQVTEEPSSSLSLSLSMNMYVGKEKEEGTARIALTWEGSKPLSWLQIPNGSAP